MLDRIIYFSIHNKLIIGLFTAALVIWGVYSVTKLPIDAVPDITDNQVQIITTSPSLAAQEVERLVTFPVETAMATIPNIREIRSMSRFGLSVITIVFKDQTDVYWARQQVTERLKTASEQIPDGIGSPELAPVTTGLGEIYQYVLHTKKGYETRYPPMELRSVQDWIVRRQLLGTDGVADVSSFGGFLKQYEIAIDPFKLRSFQISISDIFAALEKNNQNTGGAYIDKKPNAYFIRSEGLIESLTDIGQIQVKQTPDGLPVLIRDLATVRFGHAVRYGAMTRNDEGEVVGGLVLMLKGANSSQVIANVKERIEQIRKTLPDGVVIEPFLDRTKLVNNAISTVSRNLLEGALIVIFVLVLLLGNLRAGLVVASVIPLAMLFAVSMMNLFGVSGNLMSLGAIDFGLIVDGAVIIVEATLHHILGKKYTHRLSQPEMDQEVFESASKIRNSAAFGEIIILIVYLPILALVGIEGKMFRPMAQTVSFSILGAFILSLTYVPMVSALFLSKQNTHKVNISDKIIAFFHRLYIPALAFSLRRSFVTIFLSVVLFAISVYLFLNMGGEFIPQLDEGDFAVETRVLTGSSLSETVDAVQKASGILNKEFPDEVIETVGKIGSSEIPTDPMPVEAADLMVILKDKSQWKKAKNREELAEKMQAVLEERIAGVTFGFQQPIQMRFNELMTGVKQDVAIKIFGEDLEVLAEQAKKIGKLVRSVEGAEDVYVEEISGLPQIVVKFKRDQMSRFGVSIEDANRTINTAFAGSAAGIVYEGEKRFDLVVRLNQESRKTMDDVSKLFVSTSHGELIPLEQIAFIEIKTGANQIQREDAKRRITVSFNVRGRDVSSIVDELQSKIDQNIKLPAGYYTTYGGQFQNLREANTRLSIAVPIALLLIFVLLYFTFNSLRQSLLILTAIPLSAIGGVLALWIRGMPFSISAGIGFIALFGVAVLNGIVLIAEFNFLRKQGLNDLKQVIQQGTETRLRPVLMTALVASLGFLPMALSTNAGAEVQRPLATVVIGGLVSATLLTLLVLPVLYLLTEKRFNPGNPIKAVSLLLLVFITFSLIPSKVSAQTPDIKVREITLQDAIREATDKNLEVRDGLYQIEFQEALKKTAADLPKTELSWMAGQYNSTRFDNHFTFSQSIPNPATVRKRKDVFSQQVNTVHAKLEITKAELTRQVKKVYIDLLFSNHQKILLDQQSQRTDRFVKAAELRYKTGEANKLEYSVALSEQADLQARIINLQADQRMQERQLQLLMNSPNPVVTSDDSLSLLEIVLPDSSLISDNPYLNYLRQQIGLEQKLTSLQRSNLLPDFSLGYFNQSLTGFQNVNGTETFFGSGKRFQGFQVGLSLPVFNGATKARIKAAGISEKLAQNQLEISNQRLMSQFQQALDSYKKAAESLSVFKSRSLPLANEISSNATKAYEAGEIGYIEFSQSLSKALNIQLTHLNLLKLHNDSVIEIEFLINK
ncbi:CusA/CzcA family heavy metal efflux RND transporter [Dyadobacter psychrotolerans]|uniref:CusA/CzcA family heavy metal efflux RND transporter n=1 Tax=Dyadobacter psychrotolerans TaxID=2541721 RepID=A0A4R5DA77_9BACT|nr:CusA/CzcA family heavy metal efflux RND transporter [Dyadobacter psychrotolerans]TDE10532.1 CusA/CzcA family heavy metal efflux RND transporter [Dyadobacter psychrotolerans]